LRHSFTSVLANAGVSPELRMKLTGHSSEAVHRGYTHHELDTLKAAVSKLPALSGEPAKK
jgi:integrase